ncbi:transcriptional regulator [Bacillaceae bacterium SIJ1]|uniref:competence protein ComK n=1 Tax=Litoribacterium kuwaitense TaxID=1398745 RepID=UPI0013EDB854|nr:competence protein ComK [Litoribacterium kuwaitense]NGP44496.1 transcriptional regulator [Litoribacterium kuwaitense]
MKKLFPSSIYNIQSKALAVFPEICSNGQLFSRVLEENADYLLDIKPFDLVRLSCEYYGSSLRGRQDGTKALSGITYKPPIVLSTSADIYLFPTTSPSSSQCCWISFKCIEKIKPISKEVFIQFNEKEKWRVNISPSSLKTQINRITHLRQLMNNRVI